MRLNVLDDATGKPLDGACEIIKMIGRMPVLESSAPFRQGGLEFDTAAVDRLRISSPGHRTVMKSIFMDDAPLLNQAFEMREETLLSWKTFEEVRDRLQHVSMEVRLPLQ